LARNSNANDVLRTAFISLWGVLTLVLFFTVGFLVYQLARSDSQTVASGIPRMPIGSGAAEQAVQGRPVTLYFADNASVRLTPADRSLVLTESTIDNCRAAFIALAEGPRSNLVPVMPQAAKSRAMYLLSSGELVVDLSREVESPFTRSASAEWLMIQSIVHTLAQPALQGANDRPVATVRLLYEGSPMAEGFPSHIALTEPLRPDRSLLGGE
jgi:spore germination protein GerM